MGKGWLAALAVLGCVAGTSAGWADDPHDPAMRSAAARARDRAVIRQLNLRELAHVRQRDARYARQWHAWRDQGAARAEHRRRLQAYDRQRARHERDMAAWRRAVAACRAGDYRYCAR